MSMVRRETARLQFDAEVAESLPRGKQCGLVLLAFPGHRLFALFQFRRTSRAGRYTNKTNRAASRA